MGESISGPEIEAARAEMREAIAARGISNAEAARQSGIAQSTLAAWLAGKYNGDNGRIAEQARTWISHQTEQAKTRAATPALPDYVATPTAESILNVLMFAQTTPDIVLITGASGIGKTSAMEQYRATHPNVWMYTAKPSSSSLHATLEGICDAMGIRTITTRRSPAILSRAKGSGGLLIVDEAQHLRSEAFDEIRSIYDEAKIGIAVAGNSEVFARIDGDSKHGLFAQFRSRVGMRIARQKPLVGDVEALLDATGVAGPAERKLLRVIAGKPGALRGMAKTLRVAAIIAAAEGGEITEAHVRAAAARLYDNSGAAEAA